MDNFQIAQLIKKNIINDLSLEEVQLLEKWKNESESNRELYNKLINTEHQLHKLDTYNSFRKKNIQKNLEDELFGKESKKLTPTFLKYAAAILLPVLILTGILLYNTPNKEVTIANIDKSINPGSQKAILVLSNGESISLNDNNTNKTIEEAGTTIHKIDKELKYSESENNGSRKELVYNELKTPNGGEYQLQLADGTRVWLNAQSTIKFPVHFSDSVREVFISGEVFFDVSHTGKPFIVKTNKIDVRVLGTQFNVSAYPDEPGIITTLVEGKVAVNIQNTHSNQKILTPGLQASVQKNNNAIDVKKVNTSQYTSWKEGKLEFNNQNLEFVMRRLARWYEFDYNFENEEAKKYHFSARIDADENISTILKMLEMTTNVQFTLVDNRIIIN